MKHREFISARDILHHYKGNIEYECKRVLEIFKIVDFKLAFTKYKDQIKIFHDLKNSIVSMCLYDVQQYLTAKKRKKLYLLEEKENSRKSQEKLRKRVYRTIDEI